MTIKELIEKRAKVWETAKSFVDTHEDKNGLLSAEDTATYNKMEKEIEHRKLVVRKEALESVKEARAHGDLSENFEYKAAKKYKNENESRIRYLERMIKTAQIVEDISEENEVGLNDTVTVCYEDDGTEEDFKIVTTVRCDALNQMISIDSPMGKALLGSKIGERVEVKVNDKVSYYVKIKEICKSDDESEEINKF